MNSQFIRFFCASGQTCSWKSSVMGLLGDVSRAILIYTCIFWVFAIVSLFVVGQGCLAIIATVFFIIPLYMVVSEHLKTKKNSESSTDVARALSNEP